MIANAFSRSIERRTLDSSSEKGVETGTGRRTEFDRCRESRREKSEGEESDRVWAWRRKRESELREGKEERKRQRGVGWEERQAAEQNKD